MSTGLRRKRAPQEDPRAESGGGNKVGYFTTRRVFLSFLGGAGIAGVSYSLFREGQEIKGEFDLGRRENPQRPLPNLHGTEAYINLKLKELGQLLRAEAEVSSNPGLMKCMAASAAALVAAIWLWK